MEDNTEGGAVTLDQLEDIYRSRYGDFLRLAQAIVGDAESAKDVVHDAFVSAVQNRSTFSGRGSRDGWVWRVVLNKARDHLRRRPTLSLDEDRATEHVDEPMLDRTAVRAAVARLPVRQRHVLFLHYFGDLDYGTIAEALAIQPGTVAATLHAARGALRYQLDEVVRGGHDESTCSASG